MKPTRPLITLAALLSGCLLVAEPYGPPQGTHAYTPPPVYAQWWAQVEGCSKRARNMDEIRWMAAPTIDGTFSYRNNAPGQGVYVPERTVIIAEQSVGNGPIVRRMMYHAITQADTGVAKCAGVVAQ